MPGKVAMVCGLIGSGKTSLSAELAMALGPGTLFLAEPDEKSNRNPYLQDYYGDSKRYALTMQIHLLALRYRMHLQAQWYVMNTGQCAVMDSAFYQDTAFACVQRALGLMEDREFSTYQLIYQAMTSSVLLPTVCLRMLCEPETCNERIAKRMEKQQGRRCEVAIDLTYLRLLDAEINHMCAVLRDQGVLVLEVLYDTDRDSVEQRAQTVKSLATRIHAITPPDLFLDLHRRTV
jgi:deoxyadenosine/deoxycytidine kinase